MNNDLFHFLTIAVLMVLVLTVILLVILISRLGINLFKRDKIFPRRNLVVVVTGAIVVSFYALNWQFNSSFLPEGYLNERLTSPNGEYEVRIYHYSGLIDYKNVRVSIFDKDREKSETIYYNFVDGPLNVEWVDEETLAINNMVLTIHEDSYDFRKEN